MKLKEIIKHLEHLCPQKIAEKGDPIGMQTGDIRRKIKQIIIALDCSETVIQKAIETKCNLIITHHPLLWPSKEKAKKNQIIKNKLDKLNKNRINLFSLHTNYDKKFLKNEIMEKLPTQIIQTDEKEMLIFGKLQEQTNFLAVLKILKKIFKTSLHWYCKEKVKKVIKTIALVPGAGGFALDMLIENKADLFITGELKWSQWIKCKDLDQCTVTIGHQTEEIFIDKLTEKLTKIFGNKIQIKKHLETPINCF